MGASSRGTPRVRGALNGVAGPYDPKRSDGVDALVTSLESNGVKPGSNVYAELGSTWRLAMRDPDTAAHLIGKLARCCGPRNILWGTDSIWYGSPQDQIQAFRSFQIAPRLREQYGYPEMTPALRADIFGGNALRIYPVPPEVLRMHVKGDKVARLERGKIYVIEFWATWCGPCRAVIPHLTKLQQKHKDVIFIGVSAYERDQKVVKPFVEKMGDKMAYRVALDVVPEGAEPRDGSP